MDADPKAIQQIEFLGQLKIEADAIVAGESIFVLTILENIKQMRIKFSQGSETVKIWRSKS